MTANRHSKVEGNAWETVFEREVKISGFGKLDFPDGHNLIGGYKNARRCIPVKTPCDYVFGKLRPDGTLFAAVIDTKTTAANTFTYSNITEHQMIELLSMERSGFCAGYIVYFRVPNRVVFYSAGKLSTVRPRESLSPDDGLDLGTVYSMRLDRLLDYRKATHGYEGKEEDRKETLYQENWVQDDGSEEEPS